LAALIAPPTPWETGIAGRDRPSYWPATLGGRGRSNDPTLSRARAEIARNYCRTPTELSPRRHTDAVARDSQLLPLPNCQRTVTDQWSVFPSIKPSAGAESPAGRESVHAESTGCSDSHSDRQGTGA